MLPHRTVPHHHHPREILPVPVDPALVSRSAIELIDRHGATAIERATELVERATRAGDVPALDLALLVLSEVERRLQAAGSEVIR